MWIVWYYFESLSPFLINVDSGEKNVHEEATLYMRFDSSVFSCFKIVNMKCKAITLPAVSVAHRSIFASEALILRSQSFTSVIVLKQLSRLEVGFEYFMKHP